MQVTADSACDWADDLCMGDEPWTSRCAGCRRLLRICNFHMGYHVAYEVLGPACPTCGTRDIAKEIPDVSALDFTRPFTADDLTDARR